MAAFLSCNPQPERDPALQKRYLPITVSVVLLAIIALVGYMMPAASEEMPRRVLFDNTGGKVIFSHLTHDETYGIECATCHHESEDPGKDPLKCGLCHPPEFTADYITDHPQFFEDEKHCARCHHAEFAGMQYDHDQHAADYNFGSCTDCHHDTDIEPEPQACSDCHMEQGDEMMPSLENAAHEKCASCHQMQMDEGLQGCSYCHSMIEYGESETLPATSTCGSCHDEPVEQLIPTRMNAFHDGCMGCHEGMGAGPYKEDQCNQCHMPR